MLDVIFDGSRVEFKGATRRSGATLTMRMRIGGKDGDRVLRGCVSECVAAAEEAVIRVLRNKMFPCTGAQLRGGEATGEAPLGLEHVPLPERGSSRNASLPGR